MIMKKLLGNTRCYLSSISVILVLFISACAEQSATSNNENALDGSASKNSIRANAVSIEPVGRIDSPATDITINVGDKVNFAASGTDPNGNGPLTYLWDFNGLLPTTLIQNPGNLTISQPGVYRVQLFVTNRIGISDSTPEERIITVNEGNNPPSNNPETHLPPVATIVSPPARVSVIAGDALFFNGSASSASNLSPFTYAWGFDGVIPDTDIQTPGSVRFPTPGVFHVSLLVTDSLGTQNVNNASVEVTVLAVPNRPANAPPSGTIISPPGDLSVPIGTRIYFTGSGNDPDNSGSISYHWDFTNIAPDSDAQSPGTIEFMNPGVYPIRLTVRDSAGAIDPNPPIRTVTVTDVKIENHVPLDSVILSPQQNVTINAGEAVTFLGQGTTNNIVGPLRYLWDFDGAAPASGDQSPGDIVFSQPGRYEVELIIGDANGDIVSKEVSRKITVLNAPPGSTPPPIGGGVGGGVGGTPGGGTVVNTDPIIISSPPVTQELVINQAITFEAIVQDPTFSPNKFLWRFDGKAASQITEAPTSNPVTFTRTGEVKLKLLAYDTIARVRKSTELTYQIVDAGTAPTPAPIPAPTPGPTPTPAPIPTPNTGVNNDPVVFTSPSAGQVLNINEAVTFEVKIQDPTFTPGRFIWRFGGKSPSQFTTSPSSRNVSFAQTGDINVQVLVFDSVTNARINASATYSVVDPNVFQSLSVASSNDEINEILAVLDPNALTAQVVLPFGDQSVNAGEIMTFHATVNDPLFSSNLVYRWSFDGVAPDADTLDPAPVLFNNKGKYKIRFSVRDIVDNRTATAETITIRVRDPDSLIATILNPEHNKLLYLGETILFEGVATDPLDSLGLNLNYRWRFGNGIPDSFVQNPGPVTFNQAGKFEVKMFAEDPTTRRKSRSDKVKIIVSPFGEPVGPTARLSGTITTPPRDLTIPVGTTVDFASSGFDPKGLTPLVHFWNFDGAAPNSLARNPGSVTFSHAGIYVIKLTVKNAAGEKDSNPPTVTITVI